MIQIYFNSIECINLDSYIIVIVFIFNLLDWNFKLLYEYYFYQFIIFIRLTRKRYLFHTFLNKLTSLRGLGVVFQAISLSKHNPVAQQAPDPTSKSCSVDTCRSGVQIPQSPLFQIILKEQFVKARFHDHFNFHSTFFF